MITKTELLKRLDEEFERIDLEVKTAFGLILRANSKDESRQLRTIIEREINKANKDNPGLEVLKTLMDCIDEKIKEFS